MNKNIIGLLLLMLSIHVHAELYKCTKDGKISYQQQPCENSSKELKKDIKTSEIKYSVAMLGCYEVLFPGWESGSHTVKYSIKNVDRGKFELIDLNSKGKTTLPMKQATSEEITLLSKGLHLDINEGVSVVWNQGTPNQKPIGMYKGKDNKGNEIYFAYFFFSNGLAKKVACP